MSDKTICAECGQEILIEYRDETRIVEGRGTCWVSVPYLPAVKSGGKWVHNSCYGMLERRKETAKYIGRAR